MVKGAEARGRAVGSGKGKAVVGCGPGAESGNIEGQSRVVSGRQQNKKLHSAVVQVAVVRG